MVYFVYQPLASKPLESEVEAYATAEKTGRKWIFGSRVLEDIVSVSPSERV